MAQAKAHTEMIPATKLQQRKTWMYAWVAAVLTVVVVVVIVVVMVVIGGSSESAPPAAGVSVSGGSNGGSSGGGTSGSNSPVVVFTTERAAVIGASAMEGLRRPSLMPVRGGSRRRRQLTEKAVNGTAILNRCPSDSQVMTDQEATQTTVYDGQDSLFAIVDAMICLMGLTRPAANETINRGVYLAVVDETKCQGELGKLPPDLVNPGSSSVQPVLRTFAVESTRPTEENPNQPFSVRAVMQIESPARKDLTRGANDKCVPPIPPPFRPVTDRPTMLKLTP